GRSAEAFDAQAKREPATHLRLVEAFAREQGVPLGGAESAGNRGSSVEPDDPVPAHRAREQRPALVGEAVPVQVVDEPADGRLSFHEVQESGQLGAAHVVRDEARDHAVVAAAGELRIIDRKSTRLNSSHVKISYAV